MRQAVTTHSLVLALLLACAGASLGLVNLEWRPSETAAAVGDQISVSLYAVSSTSADELVSAMDIIIIYDSTLLSAPTLGPRQSWWMTDGFMYNAPDGINYDLADGSVMYSAWATLGTPAVVTPEGLLCVEFRFTALAPTDLAEITIAATFGSQAKTRVFDGTTPNTDIKGTLGSASIVIYPSAVTASVASAKSMPDGTALRLSGPVVTRAFDLAGFFYVEDADRTAGIRIAGDGIVIPAEGTVPTILGILTTLDGERTIWATSVTTDGSTSPIPRPLGMKIRSVSQGLQPQGLLITIWGRVVSPDGNSFLLDDGSPSPIRVELYGPPPPQAEAYFLATGVLGADTSGPVMRVNSQADLVEAGSP